MDPSSKRILTILLLAGIIGGTVAFKVLSESESQASTKPDKDQATRVTVIEASPTMLVDELETTGTITPNESVELKAEVAGRIERIGFEEHAEVDKGDLLIELDDDVMRAQLDANRQRARLAKQTLDRQKRVLDTGGVSQQAVDETQNRIAVLDAERQQILAELDNTRIRAPFDGRIGLRQVSPGDYVTAGSSIATLTMLDPVKIEFTVQARYVPRLSVGDSIEFQVDGHDETYSAEIYASDTQIDRESQTLTYAARADNASGALVPGAFADVSVVLERKEDALTIPAISLVTSGNETFIWVAEDGKVEKRPVQVGMRTRSRVEIVDGLETGEAVVVTGRQNLKPGDAVKIKTRDAFPINQVEADTTQVGTERRRLESGEYAEDRAQTDRPSDQTDRAADQKGEE